MRITIEMLSEHEKDSRIGVRLRSPDWGRTEWEVIGPVRYSDRSGSGYIIFRDRSPVDIAPTKNLAIHRSHEYAVGNAREDCRVHHNGRYDLINDTTEITEDERISEHI